MGHSRAVQVDFIKPTLKPNGMKCLKLMCATMLSISAFKFKLRRYTTGMGHGHGPRHADHRAHRQRHERRPREVPGSRGLHSSTFQLNVGASCEIGGCIYGSFRGCLWAVRTY